MLVWKIVMNNDWLDIDVVDGNKDYYCVIQQIDDYVVVNDRTGERVGVHNNIRSAYKQLRILNEDNNNTTIQD